VRVDDSGHDDQIWTEFPLGFSWKRRMERTDGGDSSIQYADRARNLSFTGNDRPRRSNDQIQGFWH
jgi:hypothetical protein